MAALKDALTLGAGFENRVEYHRFVYDFAQDGGATGTLTAVTCDKQCAVVSSAVHVLTACTSGGSATVKIGTTDDDDCIMTTTQGAVANLVADYTVGGAALPAWLDTGDVINLVIGTAALTAGKIEVVVGLLPLR
jgi:hypothetical protein